MANKRKQFTEEQRRDAVQYVEDHPSLTMRQCADNLGIGLSTLHRMKAKAKNSPDGAADFAGSGHYSSAFEKENARLKREIKDTQKALKILKKSHKHSGKLTSVLYELVHEENEKGEPFFVARVLKISDLSAFGYYA